MWAQNLFSITLFLTGFMLGSLSSEKRSYSEVKKETSSLPKLDLNLEDAAYALGHTEQQTLLVSTLDGSLKAIDMAKGEVIWELSDEPVVRSPYDSSNPVLPAFLPDPKDGSLYMIGSGMKEPLKKLPFTIPELVAASPCKSTDGILYTGKKVDTWFSVDRYTGSKQGSLTFDGCLKNEEDSCPNIGPSNFLVGRTEYTIMMYDSKTPGRKWNISYFDYTSNMATAETQSDYNFAHFTDSSKGDLVTLDKRTGMVDWRIDDIGSPIVALYRLDGDGIISTPMTSVSQETLSKLISHFDENDPNVQPKKPKKVNKLFSTLYVGEHEHGLFAMPSLVDQETLTISPGSNGPLLLEGPKNFKMPQNGEITLNGITDSDKGGNNDPFGIPREPDRGVNEGSVLLFGYYQVPKHTSIRLTPAIGSLQLIGKNPSKTFEHGKYIEKITPEPLFPPPSKELLEYKPEDDQDTEQENRTQPNPIPEAYDSVVIGKGFDALKTFNMTFILSKDMFKFAKELVKWSSTIHNIELKIIIVILCIGVYILYNFLMKNASHSIYSFGSFRNSSRMSNGSRGKGNFEVTALPYELEDGNIKVGNVIFDPTTILGKGCEGTFVYKGKFDNRDVAVKRVLAACFTIADREVELLRESDEHPNVIRYFCMEQDRQFRYIALEYCCATLHDYVTGNYSNPFKLDNLTILRQATQGLAHLHSLDIVHRDIKPHNVLISMPGKKGEVRAMISDFGLCKKLKVGRMSFSHRSGIAGTEGWIAPEMMLGNRSTTCGVDVFSLGCVYYFVLSNGHHPFGESFKRQANILSNEANLTRIQDDPTALYLIEKMILGEPSLRPTTSAVLKHPLFWSKEKALTYLQDVSDRVDRETTDSYILASIERNRMEIVKGNWLENLDEHVHEDLRKHRSYKGHSVRDLLGALRNKGHYNELPEVTKVMYGRLPDQFADYWMTRFPKLLIHSWMAMHCIKREPSLAKYFDKDYDFVKTFYRETINASKMSKPLTLKSEQNLFMPNFSTKNSDDPDEEINSSNNMSVISQWDKLPSADSEPDESFSEMKPTKNLISTSPAKKVIVVNQLKSQNEELKKPETWAKAVQGQKSVVPEVQGGQKSSEMPEKPTVNSCDSDEKENVERIIVDKKNLDNPITTPANLVVDNEINKDNNETIIKKEENVEKIKENSEDNDGPVWIIPTEENKPKKRKKKKKPVKDD